MSFSLLTLVATLPIADAAHAGKYACEDGAVIQLDVENSTLRRTTAADDQAGHFLVLKRTGAAEIAYSLANGRALLVGPDGATALPGSVRCERELCDMTRFTLEYGSTFTFSIAASQLRCDAGDETWCDETRQKRKALEDVFAWMAGWPAANAQQSCAEVRQACIAKCTAEAVIDARACTTGCGL